MRIKKFRASSMREALLKIKDELGENAVILKTDRVRKGLLSLGNGDVEVTAATEESSSAPAAFPPIRMAQPVRRAPEAAALPHAAESKIPPVRKGATTMLRELTSTAKRSDAPAASPVMELKEDIRQLREIVIAFLASPGELNRDGGFSGGWAMLHRRLIEAEVKPAVATRIIEDARKRYSAEKTQIDEAFAAALGAMFPIAGPLAMRQDGPLYVAFVGPTGAGKTTTLAKLAAQYVLSQQATVSIITADTYRIAAIEQIRVFADIMGIGLQVVFTPEEAEAARIACENDDVVFIDTAGRSQRNTQHMAELKSMLRSLRPHEIHLVVSATMKDSDLDDILKRYADAGVNRLIFTKLDETVHLGAILNAVSSSRMPVSYFTAGQSVPDDIELAQAGRFLHRMWEGTP